MKHRALYASTLVLVSLAALGCSSPKNVDVRSGVPTADQLSPYAGVYRGLVTECGRRANYTLGEQLQVKAPQPKNGYKLDVTVQMSQTIKGPEQASFKILIVDPEAKPFSLPSPGGPRIIVGAEVYVAYAKTQPAVVWVAPGQP